MASVGQFFKWHKWHVFYYIFKIKINFTKKQRKYIQYPNNILNYSDLHAYVNFEWINYSKLIALLDSKLDSEAAVCSYLIVININLAIISEILKKKFDILNKVTKC